MMIEETVDWNHLSSPFTLVTGSISFVAGMQPHSPWSERLPSAPVLSSVSCYSLSANCSDCMQPSEPWRKILTDRWSWRPLTSPLTGLQGTTRCTNLKNLYFFVSMKERGLGEGSSFGFMVPERIPVLWRHGSRWPGQEAERGHLQPIWKAESVYFLITVNHRGPSVSWFYRTPFWKLWFGIFKNIFSSDLGSTSKNQEKLR